MRLSTCPDCQHEVYESVPACRHFGRPLRPAFRKRDLVILSLSLSILFTLPIQAAAMSPAWDGLIVESIQTRPRRVTPTVESSPPSTPTPQAPRTVSAQNGDTLNKIGRRLNISVEQLRDLNSYLPDEPLSAGENINLPASPEAFVTPGQARRPARGRAAPTRRKAGGPAGGQRGSDYYTNVDGERVHRPVRSSSVPDGATAKCRDGTYSFSRNRRGTCSHHGGVARWL